MRRSLAFSLLVLLAAPALAGCTTFYREEVWRLELTVGVITAQTSGYPLEDVADAVDMAARQMENAGYGLTMKVLREQAGNDPAAAFDRLAQRGATAVIAAVEPQDAQALVARSAAQKRLLLLATPASAPLSGDVSYAVQVAEDPKAVGRALAALAEREGVERPVIVRAEDPFTARAADAFREAWGASADDVLHPIGSQSGTTAAAQGICDRDVDGVVILSLPDEAGWATRAIHDAGCSEGTFLLGGPWARQQDLIDEAGRDGADRPLAAGVLGVEPARARLAEFRSLFETETGRSPGPYAAEAYDASIYLALSSFAAKSSPESKPVRATIAAADLQRHVLPVATAPGTQHQELSGAISAAKAGDELDWPGYAHDDAFSERRQPLASSFAVWQVLPAGGFASGGEPVTP